MARNWTIPFHPRSMDTNTPSSAARPSFLPGNLCPSVAFDAATDESCVLEKIVPLEHTGSGTLKVRLLYAASTTTAGDDVRIDIVTEFRTPDVGENANTDNYDGTADSATLDFDDGTNPPAAYDMFVVVITLTPATTPVAGDKFRIKITRDANNGAGLDDLASQWHLLGAEVYEEV